MPSVFSRIISGELPGHIIAEDENYIAFLDVNPLAEGHTLVIPKEEIDKIFAIENELYSGLFLFAKKIAIAIEHAIPCKRVGMAVIGLEVPHAHVHLVPLQTMSDINFERHKMKVNKVELAAVCERIKAKLDN
ncbi:MAG: HIT family protein [Bacteroidota bacterium]|nr:HIT family protein [Bacteroidota bacterium]